MWICFDGLCSNRGVDAMDVLQIKEVYKQFCFPMNIAGSKTPFKYKLIEFVGVMGCGHICGWFLDGGACCECRPYWTRCRICEKR